MDITTRFAPSPTGSLHIGGVRTALYAFLVARKNQGKFLLRIEDTDRQRIIPGSVEDIIDTLKWLNLNFDDEPIFQSDRKGIYTQHTQMLVDKDLAYESEGAIWFKTTKEGKTSIVDLVGNREIEFDNSTQNDFVILKSDGFPTYHLAHVVDDHLMETNPVIRGAEWISSIPKHVMLFTSFGWEIPNYAHLPVILGPDKSKLSKRHGAKPASEFRKDGFLPAALLNYMALLGWTPKDGREILSVDEMIDQFDLKDVHISNPVFDITKLEWMNGEYIRKIESVKFKVQILENLKYLSDGSLPDHPTEEEVAKVAPIVKDRIKKLSDFIPLTAFLWEKVEYEKGIFEKILTSRDSERSEESIKKILEKILENMEKMDKPWQADQFEKTFRQFGEQHKLTATQTFQLIRVCISGQLVTPPLFESIKILGEDEVINRVKEAIRFLGS